MHGIGLTGVPAHHPGLDSFSPLREGKQLGTEADVSALATGTAQEHRFEIVLTAQAPVRGTDPRDIRSCRDVPNDPASPVPGEGVHLKDAIISGERGGGLPDTRLQTGSPENLHGAHIVSTAAWVH
ncbi:hypothetical protein GCM10010344_52570 [Streptomyces bluensis]|nr:hypothetical protein GCM10010344_52570 [Streptomyces bluensis]